MWGTEDVVAARIGEYLDTGLGGMIFNFPPGVTPEDVRRVGRLLAERFGAR
jgi:alkanesulfonate monooxygenase SsuD/methylene tetrahydromethanopterin reductase-like flavin-dependent oxidoreductase (luciferase family)